MPVQLSLSSCHFGPDCRLAELAPAAWVMLFLLLSCSCEIPRVLQKMWGEVLVAVALDFIRSAEYVGVGGNYV